MNLNDLDCCCVAFLYFIFDTMHQSSARLCIKVTNGKVAPGHGGCDAKYGQGNAQDE